MATRTPMITTTTSNSIRVKPRSPPTRFSRILRSVSCMGTPVAGCWDGGRASYPTGDRTARFTNPCGRTETCGAGSPGAPDVLVDREHRQVQADHHRPDDGPHEDDHDRLDRRGQGLGGAVDFPVVEIGNLLEHLTDLAAFFADLDHLGD